MLLPPTRRVVTGHDERGRAVIITDDTVAATANPSGTVHFSLMWTTDTVPVDNDDATDGREREVGLTLPGGSVLRIVDMAPGSRSAMHRTNSLDYGIVLSGEIELELDDGMTTTVGAGGVIVQRGTMHAWRNPSADQTARLAFVLLDAKPATVDGVALPEQSPRSAPSRT